MSTITQTPKIKTVLISENHVFSLIVVAVCLAMMAALIASAVVSNTAGSFDQNAYDLYRQGEWVSAPVSSAHAYQIFRREEVASPVTNAEAYQLYRQGEWNSVSIPATDLTPYHLSERTLVDPQAGLMQYLLSERTFVDPQSGLEIYRQSERTRIPVLFNPYQRSEWFGE